MYMSYGDSPVTLEELEKWYNTKNINPRTGKKISKNGKIYKYLESVDINGLYINRCINDIDPISLNYLWKGENDKRTIVHTDLNNIIFYKDKKGNVKFLEKDSVIQLKGYGIKYDPITKEELPDSIFDNIIGEKLLNEYEKTLEQIALDVFQLFINISIFIDYQLFLNLDKTQLIKLNYETSDFFVNNFTKEQQKKISKNVFKKSKEDIEILNDEEIKLYLLNQFKILLECKVEEYKYMINYIIVGGLGLVIHEVKESYPDYAFAFTIN